MKTGLLAVLLGILVALIPQSHSNRCDRIPVGVTKPRNRNDAGRYIIDITGNPKTYAPNEKYNISVKLDPYSLTPRTFKSFIITLEQEVTYNLLANDVVRATGQFLFGGDMLAKFSDRCPNTVVESNTLPKTEVQLIWIAPPPNSGCVAIKATVVESKDSWFSEDGPLTKILCEESSDNEDVQPMILERCYACDEAKYEVAFEGMWTRNTHPKDFPSDVWSTKFSDVVGTSHKQDNAFWQYGGIASDGLKELAETGNTKSLESELKESSDNIRTIIKARGLQYPNITLSTYAVFRVDNLNHLVSLVSKISPSPDWIVGVSNLELCRSDGTWDESRVLNLYPWDVGTDDGPTYTASNEPSIPKQPIRRIKSNSPNDPRSPFYDETGEEMKPIAKLYITRQRLYQKECEAITDAPEEAEAEAEAEEEEDDGKEECLTTDWGEFSTCSRLCGKGVMFRQRQYVNPDVAIDCKKSLVQEKECIGRSRHCARQYREEETPELYPSDDERCALEDDWSEWSGCSTTCGPGVKTRDKKLQNPDNLALCNLNTEDIEETEECQGAGEDCESPDYENDENCPDSWERWSPCNVSCNSGFKVRKRIMEDGEMENCKPEQIVECYEKPCEPMFSNLNTQNYVVSDVLSEGPDGDVVDCKVSKWTGWSSCITRDDENTCGKGYKIKVRQILVHPTNGGRACPKRLIKKMKCVIPCEDEEEEEEEEEDENETAPTWGEASNPNEIEKYDDSGCIMSRWSAWSPCSTICGSNAVQLRTRSVIRKTPGAVCPTRIMKRKCPLPLACTERGFPLM